ncbi:MAG: alpha/beta fold hydrolase [Alphaproteobacteria bacterium]|nr:alpha/beta fold hydrolase [Alphaproteobacteria bacterium]
MVSIIDVLKKIFSEVLLSPEADLSLNKPYVDMGVDSILAIQVSKLIKIHLNCDIQPSDLYNYTSIKELAKFLEEKIEAQEKLSHVIKREQETLSSKDLSSTKDTVAIIGIAGIFPGANNVDDFWKKILNKESCISISNRWEKNKYKGGFLEYIDMFDAEFFNISPKEAKLMDPQQRLLMQVSMQAFADAGLTKTELSATKCGVFTTALPGDYKYLLPEKETYSSFSFSGNAVSVQAGRISHFFNLKGPCINIDTACSSSLVCIDQAVKSLENGDCDIAFVGASSVFSTPELFKLAEGAGILSKSGQCYSFDTRADGFVPSEVVAGIVLTKHSLAKRDSRKIYATIEAVSTSHDGFTNGLMSPNGFSQEDLIRSVYEKNNIPKRDIAYIEAHGTGTKIGDPLEFNALKNALGNISCNIGTCKANIGHALVASGLASVIKVLKSMEAGVVAPQINFIQKNSQIHDSEISINVEEKQWPEDKPLAGISAFGFGGTNAHVVLRRHKKNLSQHRKGPFLFVFSGTSEKALKSYLVKMLEYLQNFEENELYSLSYTLCCLRDYHPERLVLVADTLSSLYEQIQHYISIGKSFFPEIDSQNKILIQAAQILQNGNNFYCRQLFSGEVSNVNIPFYPFDSKPYWVDSSLHQKFKSVQREKSSEALKILKEKLSQILGFNFSDIDDNAPIKSFGIDSLVALQLLEPFKEGFASLTPDMIFNQEKLSDLANYIDSSLTVNFKQPQAIQQSDSGVRLEWREEGKKSGKLLLLLPPLNTSSHIWEPQIHYFVRKGYRIFIPHYPGHVSTPYFDFTFQSLAEIIWKEFRNISNRGDDSSVLFGWSLGGCLSILLANRYPDQISRIILINTAAKFDRDIFSQSSQLRGELENKKHYLKQLFKGKKAQAVDLVGAGCSLEMLRHYYDQLNHFNEVERLSQIKVPSLITFGEKDSVINNEDIESLRKIPNSFVEKFPAEGHFVPLTTPFKFNTVAERFIA